MFTSCCCSNFYDMRTVNKPLKKKTTIKSTKTNKKKSQTFERKKKRVSTQKCGASSVFSKLCQSKISSRIPTPGKCALLSGLQTPAETQCFDAQRSRGVFSATDGRTQTESREAGSRIERTHEERLPLSLWNPKSSNSPLLSKQTKKKNIFIALHRNIKMWILSNFLEI